MTDGRAHCTATSTQDDDGAARRVRVARDILHKTKRERHGEIGVIKTLRRTSSTQRVFVTVMGKSKNELTAPPGVSGTVTY